MSAPDLWSPTQSPQTMPDGPGESFEAYRAKLKSERCKWFVSGGLLRATCELLPDGRRPGRSNRPEVCHSCGKPTFLVDE